MSRKIKTDNKTATPVNNEIIQVAEIVAKDRGIDKEELLEAMETAILKTAQLKYGEHCDIVAHIDRKTGEIFIARRLKVVDHVVNRDTEILAKDGKELGQIIEEPLPPLEFGRVAAQTAKQIITQKVKIAERKKQYEEFTGRVGEIITGVVKRCDFAEVVVDVGRAEGVLRKSDILQNEVFNVGDRISMLLIAIHDDISRPMLQLSRTHDDFLKKLLEREVPEIYDGIIKIMSIARDPGSKAKIAVATSDIKQDPIGACVGVKGSRIQAVCDELKGEKVDVVMWSDNPAVFIVNALAPADVARIVFESDTETATAVIPSSQQSIAIGRRGQNVKLASKLTGWNISIVTEEEDTKRRTEEIEQIVNNLCVGLDVDDMVARLLINEGYTSIPDIIDAGVDGLCSIDGIDNETAEELLKRADVYMEKRRKSIDNLCKKHGVADDLKNYDVISTDLLEVLVEAGIKNLQDLGDLATDELMEIAGDMLSQEDAEALIMNVRKDWFYE